MALNRRDIIDDAMSILSRYGLADLSMRRLATALGVHPGALYWHFENKQQLLAALASEVMRPVARSLEVTDGGPQRLVTTWAQNFRSALLGTRDGAELVSSAMAMRLLDPSPVDLIEQRLADQGADPRVATAVAHFVLGSVAQEQSHAQLVELGVAEPSPRAVEDDFLFGISLLVNRIGD